MLSSKKNHSFKSGIALLRVAVFFAVSGCSIGPDFEAPELNLPQTFQQESVSSSSSELACWWKNFEDPELNSLVQRALNSNLNLQLAQERVREARALLRVSRVDFFPKINSAGFYSYNRYSENVNQANSSGTSREPGTEGNENSSSRGSGQSKNLFQAGFDSIWELDIFGGTRRTVEVAQASLQAKEDAKNAVLVSLLAEVAQNYLSLRGLQQRREILLQAVAAEQETLELQKTKLSAGIASSLTVAQAQAQLESTRAQLPVLLTSIDQVTHRLGILVGENPQALREELQSVELLPHGPPTIPIGIPSDLLRRRADVAQAEMELSASTAQIGVALADLFPRVNLLGTLGYKSERYDKLFESQSQFLSLKPIVSWDILSWYSILDNVEVQNARQSQALIRYRQVVLQAIEEVENALSSQQHERQRFETLKQSVLAHQQALELAKQMNTAGVVDFLNVLNSQQQVYEAQDLLAQSELAVSANLVALYKALGGGWEALQ